MQGAVQAVESVKTGIEQSTQAAEKAVLQAFALLRQAVNSRETVMLEVSYELTLTFDKVLMMHAHLSRVPIRALRQGDFGQDSTNRVQYRANHSNTPP